jgi:hypothetical protein
MVLGLMVSLILVIIGIYWAIYLEKKDWNKGLCPKCGGRWRCYGTTFGGDRFYNCSECNNPGPWISYHNVDKDYKHIPRFDPITLKLD